MQIHLMLQIWMKTHCFNWLQVVTEALSSNLRSDCDEYGCVCTRAIHIG